MTETKAASVGHAVASRWLFVGTDFEALVFEINKAILEEREACAKTAENIPEHDMNRELRGVEFGNTQGGYRRGRQMAAQQIRMRTVAEANRY
jgi:hypothetical protein